MLSLNFLVFNASNVSLPNYPCSPLFTLLFLLHLQLALDKFEYLPIKCNVVLGKLTCQRNREKLKKSNIWGSRTPRTKVRLIFASGPQAGSFPVLLNVLCIFPSKITTKKDSQHHGK